MSLTSAGSIPGIVHGETVLGYESIGRLAECFARAGILLAPSHSQDPDASRRLAQLDGGVLQDLLVLLTGSILSNSHFFTEVQILMKLLWSQWHVVQSYFAGEIFLFLISCSSSIILAFTAVVSSQV